MTARRIVALGGGTFQQETGAGPLHAYVLSLARTHRPRVCFVPTASGDSDVYVAGFYRSMMEHDCTPGELRLFSRTVADLREFVLQQDVIYVGGGNTISLLAVWRAHGLDAVVAEALDHGVVLVGESAGMMCFFEASAADSTGDGPKPFTDGLGLLPGSVCPHYDSEPRRKLAFLKGIIAGELPEGYGIGDGAGLVFDGGRLTEAVRVSESASTVRVRRSGDAKVAQEPLPALLLGG